MIGIIEVICSVCRSGTQAESKSVVALLRTCGPCLKDDEFYKYSVRWDVHIADGSEDDGRFVFKLRENENTNHWWIQSKMDALDLYAHALDHHDPAKVTFIAFTALGSSKLWVGG